MSYEISCPNMCRACMKVDCVLLPMYGDSIISSKNLPDKLAELASIKIDRYDGLPSMLCATCAYRTDVFYHFKLQVQETERKLRQMFENQTPVIIKNEVIDERHSEDDIVQVDESSELDLTEDKRNVLEDSTTDAIHEIIKNDQPVEIDVSQLVGNNEDNKNNIYLNAVLLSNLQETTDDQVGAHSVKTEITEEISKLFQSQQLDYTIMYIPEGVLGSISESTIENPFVVSNTEESKIENGILIPTVQILNEQKNVEDILNDVCISNPMEFKIAKKSNDVCWINEDENTIENKNKEGDNQINLKAEEIIKIEDSDGSDSDYFIDPKDNILGSLNDTITRIKEVKLEGNLTAYQCTLCLQNYDKLTDVLLHTIDNHIPSSGPFFCVVCEKDCDSHRELRAHAKTHTGRFPYSCFICNKAYTMKRYLKRHMVCHTDLPRYRCPKCGIRFKDKLDLESHLTTHMHGSPYACSQCPRLFNHKGNYKRHLITHLDPQGLHLPKYPCTICGKRFLNNRTLETHTRVHTGEKPFKCEICGRAFSQQGNLLNHARIHSNPRSYTCEVCGKRFNQRATLRDHGLLHTGEKPYVCNVCGVAFTFSAALRRHMWTHAGGKPFGCEVCSARFVGKYDLRRHMRIHADKPKPKRKKNATSKSSDLLEIESKEENLITMEEPNTETVLIEEVLLPQNVTEVVHQVESEKENVDALFNLIQYG